jgi:signal transduction histidine kinase
MWFVGPAVLSAVWWTVTSPHFTHPELRAAFLAYAIAAPVLVGLLWWHRRPESTFGPLLTAFGFAAWPLCLQGSAVPLLFSMGVVAEAPYAFMTFLLCLCFPRGRLASRSDWGLLGTWVLVLVLGWIPYLAMLPSLQGGGPLSACAPSCPQNAFVAYPMSAGLLTFIGQAGTIATVLLASLLLGRQIVGLATASAPTRRARWPVVASISLFLVCFAGYHLQQGFASMAPEATFLVTTFYVASFVILPIGFLAALVRADLFAGRAARRLASSLSAVEGPGGVRQSLANALDDPTLRLGIRDPHSGRFIQPDGTELSAARSDVGEIWVPIARVRETVAGFVTDEAFTAESRLLETATDAALVAIADREIADDAMALRAAAVSATDTERQRIARDMHDSAQQRLVALRVQVSLASEKLEDQPEAQAALNRLGRELDDAIEDVRNVARRFLTPFVVRNGLGLALRSITRTWPISVVVDDRGLSRHEPATELSVYNLCLEALQNVLDHGGPQAAAQVRIKDAADGIWFSVTDNGVGFDPQTTQPGAGLLGMSDRALLAGGAITVDAVAGQGVRISGRIPSPARGS